jgi:hypothetical protein
VTRRGEGLVCRGGQGDRYHKNGGCYGLWYGVTSVVCKEGASDPNAGYQHEPCPSIASTCKNKICRCDTSEHTAGFTLIITGQ